MLQIIRVSPHQYGHLQHISAQQGNELTWLYSGYIPECPCQFAVKLLSCSNYITVLGESAYFCFQIYEIFGWTLNASNSCEFLCI